MFGLLSALAMTAGLSASPSTSAPPAARAAHDPRPAVPAVPAPAPAATTPGAALSQAIKSYLESSGVVASSQLQVPRSSPVAVPGGAAPTDPMAPAPTGVDPGAGAVGATAVTAFGPPGAFGPGALFGPGTALAVRAPVGPALVAMGSGGAAQVAPTAPWGSAPAATTGGNGWTVADGWTAVRPSDAANPVADEAASGPGGPGSTSAMSGGTGDCNITVTDLTIPLAVRCTTGDSGNASGTGTGGDSGAVVGIVPSDGRRSGAGAAAVSFFDNTGIATGSPGQASPSAIEGTTGNCLLATTNAFAALSVSCTPGAVGTAEASVAGGSPGAAGVSGASGSGAGPDDSAPGAAISGTGGAADTTVTSGRTGNCIIHLVNIRAALTVVCITGSSGPAVGLATGGRSGSATLLSAGSGASSAGASSGGTTDGIATSGTGGNAMAIISSGSTGSCIIFLVNVMASVTVLCITGNSGPASGTAVGGASGSALLVAASGADGPSTSDHAGVSGSGGRSSAVVTSGGTGNCVISLTNIWGSISLLCRTGNSGPALGRATGGDSGSALVMLKAPSPATAATGVGAASPFASFPAAPPWHGGPAGTPAPVDGPDGARAPAAGLVAERVVESPAGLPGWATTGSPPAAAGRSSLLPVTGLGTPVPLSLAAGLMLSGGLGVAATTRRRRRIRQH